jgi:hypothetical protein
LAWAGLTGANAAAGFEVSSGFTNDVDANVAYIKSQVKQEYNVTLSDNGATNPYFTSGSRGLKWDLKNAQLAYLGLTRMNASLGGDLQSSVGSGTFTLNTHPDSGNYFGHTSGLTIDFYVSSTIPLINLCHEFGHVLDNAAGDSHTTALGGSPHSSSTGVYWFGGNGYGNIDPSLVLTNSQVDDPFFGPLSVDALQHADSGPVEQWADIFANYVVGNINQNLPGGRAMYTWVKGQLQP